MNAIDRQFTKIINGTMQFVIPVFQRDYSWVESQCEQLWNDILLVAQDESGRGHFMGSVVYVPTGDSSAGFTRWLLIDGQQRVTTITIMLIALRDHIMASGWNSDDEDAPTAKRIDAYFLKNMQEEGAREHKLILRRDDQETLRALVDGVAPPVTAAERILDNYEYFRAQIAKEDPAVIYKGIGRLVVVDVTLDRVLDDPQLIFESLNSTGVDLSQSDLIRNYILMRLPEKEQTRLWKMYWSKLEVLFRGNERLFDAFVRDFIALITESKRQEKSNQIYHAFRRIFQDLVIQQGSLESLLSKMLQYAEYHAAFSVSTGKFTEVATELSRLRRLVDVPAVLVMKLFACYKENKTLTEEEFKEAISIIETYVLRRAVCGHQTRGYWSVFATLAYGIEDNKPLESLKVELSRQTYIFPTDEEFGQELRTRELYGMRICSVVLERLENFDTKEPTPLSGLSIEHIIPQNPKLVPKWRKMLGDDWERIQRTYLHRLGNLTLTAYNSTYSDRSFEEKKTIKGGFVDSAVRLNKFVREQEQWTEKEILTRQEFLVAKSLKVWPMLEVSASAVAAAKNADLRALAKNRNVSTVPMTEKGKKLYTLIAPLIMAMSPDILEVAEKKSISYHVDGRFFLEVLPRTHNITLILPLEYNEIEDPAGVAKDSADRTFVMNACYEGGVLLKIKTPEDVDHAIPLIQQAFTTVDI